MDDLAVFLTAEMEPDEQLGEHMLFVNNYRITGGYIVHRPAGGYDTVILATLSSDELNARWQEVKLEWEIEHGNDGQ